MKILILSATLFFSINSFSQGSDLFFKKTDKFFSTYVSNGLVKYEAIKNNHKTLDSIIDLANTLDLDDLDLVTKKAFWINSYNLITIKSVINNYPIDSPLNVTGFFDSIKHAIGGDQLTLNEIENKKIRDEFNDPRIHFVLVCAGLGCPPIINSAYLPETLDAQLETQTRLALNDSNFIQINDNKRRASISELFKWYKKDFVTKESDLISYINQYRDKKIPDNYKINYYPYNWNLNKI